MYTNINTNINKLIIYLKIYNKYDLTLFTIFSFDMLTLFF